MVALRIIASAGGGGMTPRFFPVPGFGIKFHALQSPTVRQLLYSSDSMAWSFAGRKSGTEHDPRIALAYAAKLEALIGQPSFVQPQLFHWWNETEHNAR
jgi:hypothetical protein